MFLEGTICVQKCATLYYGEISNYTCLGCADGCLTCYGPALTQCLTCTTATNTTSFYKVAAADTCAIVCPGGQFISSIFAHQCDLCAANCVTCVDRADKCTSTGGCLNGMFYHAPTFQCLITCPNGYYGEVGNYTCTACLDGCELCYGATTSTCTKCKMLPDGVTPYFKFPYTDVCGPTCPTGFFGQTLAFRCDPCQ